MMRKIIEKFTRPSTFAVIVVSSILGYSILASLWQSYSPAIRPQTDTPLTQFSEEISLFTSKHQNFYSAVITRVIDGDTVIVSNLLYCDQKFNCTELPNPPTIIRFASTDAPEKNEPGFKESSAFISQFTRRWVFFSPIGSDTYDRTIADLFVSSYESVINLSAASVSLGFAREWEN